MGGCYIKEVVGSGYGDKTVIGAIGHALQASFGNKDRGGREAMTKILRHFFVWTSFRNGWLHLSPECEELKLSFSRLDN